MVRRGGQVEVCTFMPGEEGQRGQIHCGVARLLTCVKLDKKWVRHTCRACSHLYFLVWAHGQLPSLGQEHDGEGDESGGEDAGRGAEVPVGRGHHQASQDPEDPDRRVKSHGEAYVESLAVVLANSPEL